MYIAIYIQLLVETLYYKQVLACTVEFQLQFKIGIIPTILVVFAVVFNVLVNFTKLTNAHNIVSDSSGKIKAIIIILIILSESLNQSI